MQIKTDRKEDFCPGACRPIRQHGRHLVRDHILVRELNPKPYREIETARKREREREREGGRERGREGGREGGRERERESARARARERASEREITASLYSFFCSFASINAFRDSDECERLLFWPPPPTLASALGSVEVPIG